MFSDCLGKSYDAVINKIFKSCLVFFYWPKYFSNGMFSISIEDTPIDRRVVSFYFFSFIQIQKSHIWHALMTLMPFICSSIPGSGVPKQLMKWSGDRQNKIPKWSHYVVWMVLVSSIFEFPLCQFNSEVSNDE